MEDTCKPNIDIEHYFEFVCVKILQVRFGLIDCLIAVISINVVESLKGLL